MKRLRRNFFLAGMVSVVSFTFLNAKQTTIFAQENSDDNVVKSVEQQGLKTENNSPIMCDEDDEEVCDYIEQESRESSLKIWLYDLGMIVMTKLITLREYFDKCKNSLDTWIKKVLCPAKKNRTN